MKKNKKSKIKCKCINLKFKKSVLAFFMVVVFLMGLFTAYMKFLVNPIIVDIGYSDISELANYAMNQAVSNVMNSPVTYDDLIQIVTDSSGKISMLQANTVRINSLSRDIIEDTYHNLFVGDNYSLSIPLGMFTGLPIFSALGPNVNIDYTPFGNVYCTFMSKFVSAGINQTYHKIFLVINTDVTIVLPFNTLNIKNESEMLFCESLIIGEVPQTYLMAESTGDMLNLVPD